MTDDKKPREWFINPFANYICAVNESGISRTVNEIHVIEASYANELERERDSLRAEQIAHLSLIDGQAKQIERLKQQHAHTRCPECGNEGNDLGAKLETALSDISLAIEYLEPRLAGKVGSQGLTIVLSELKKILAKLKGE